MTLSPHLHIWNLFLFLFYFDYLELKDTNHCFSSHPHKQSMLQLPQHVHKLFRSEFFLEDIGEKLIQLIVIYCDNVSGIKLKKNLVHHNKINNFDMKYHFIHDLVHMKYIELKHINTKDLLVDIFTKEVTKDQFLALLYKIVNPH